MDRKSIIVLIISFALLVVWFPLMNKLYPPRRVSGGTNMLAGVTNQTVPLPGPSAVAPTTPVMNVRPPALAIPSGAKEEPLVVTNENARYTFTTFGGGLKLIELLKYPDTIACNSARKETRLASLNTAAPLPILALAGGELLQGGGIYQLTLTSGVVRAEMDLSNGLHVVKEFRLSSNYLVRATARLENRSALPLLLPPQEWNVGTATPMGPLDNGQMVEVIWCNGTKLAGKPVNQAWFANRSFGCVPGTPLTQYLAGQNNVAWAAAQNQFFVMALMPKEPAWQIVGYQIDLPPPGGDVLAENPKATAKPIGFQASVIYAPTNLPAGQSIEKSFTLYAGPKENRVLERLALELNNEIDLVMGWGFFGVFAKALLWSMNGLHALGLSYALAIIAITVIIKLLFWPLTQASTRSMKKMQALQPQIKALQEKFKDDPAKMQRKMMEFWKEHKVNPVGGCLPMFLQLPVFIGFFTMVRSAIELRGARFLWACDLSKSDTLFIIPGLNFPFNPLPLLMGVTMLWQARLTPASPGMDPAQQKIMKYMPLIFLVVLYNYSAGLTLYWTVQNLLTIAQMKLTKAQDGAAAKTPASVLAPKRKP